jgi:hypothetical protein
MMQPSRCKSVLSLPQRARRCVRCPDVVALPPAIRRPLRGARSRTKLGTPELPTFNQTEDPHDVSTFLLRNRLFVQWTWCAAASLPLSGHSDGRFVRESAEAEKEGKTPHFVQQGVNLPECPYLVTRRGPALWRSI